MRRKLLATLAVLVLAVTPARACTVALLLAIDVSNSIDPAEYRIQTDGLAEALLDAEVREALVTGTAAIAVIQWSGLGRQEITIPWRKIGSDADVLALSAEARAMTRAFILSDTAVGDLVDFARNYLGQAPQGCGRQVVDISGDGTDNAGTDPVAARQRAEAAGITINALAIEGIGISITNFFRRRVITRDGFVMTARGHTTYAETLRRKLRRELSQIMF
jgi:Ca-activated chloride channel family protein